MWARRNRDEHFLILFPIQNSSPIDSWSRPLGVWCRCRGAVFCLGMRSGGLFINSDVNPLSSRWGRLLQLPCERRMPPTELCILTPSTIFTLKPNHMFLQTLSPSVQIHLLKVYSSLCLLVPKKRLGSLQMRSLWLQIDRPTIPEQTSTSEELGMRKSCSFLSDHVSMWPSETHLSFIWTISSSLLLFQPHLSFVNITSSHSPSHHHCFCITAPVTPPAFARLPPPGSLSW